MTSRPVPDRREGKIVATIEARMTSSRLPGKVLLPVLGRTMLERLILRLQAVPAIDEIVLATTTNPSDDALADLARALGARAFRGSESDVLGRVLEAAERAGADVIVQITGDCPIIDPELVEQTIAMYRHNDVAYASNSSYRSYPDGMDTQVFSLAALAESSRLTEDPLDREHVSLHMINHPELFPHVVLVAPPSLTWPELGLTLDEPSDFELLTEIIEALEPGSPLFGLRQVIDYLRDRPELVGVNSKVARKGAT